MMLAPTRSESSPDSAVSSQVLSLAPSLAVGFLPAFRHQDSGEVRLCQFPDGAISSMHLLDSLPAEWVLERDLDGRPAALIGSVEAGFLRGLDFWSLGELLHPRLDG